ncbi:MAG: hypothetical protein MHPSP_004917, partial [Paramarteilia canceri]
EWVSFDQFSTIYQQNHSQVENSSGEMLFKCYEKMTQSCSVSGSISENELKKIFKLYGIRIGNDVDKIFSLLDRNNRKALDFE